MARKIIFLDVDGTLVNYGGKLPDSAARGAAGARKRAPRVHLHRP